ncbi:MAG: hypothetical protein HY717_02880 [Planctomycetes bacterium]|nr:hypothetical protein [Planctomycetota bacterium]
MSRKSIRKRIVRKSATEIRRSTPLEIAPLAAQIHDPVDTSELPERTGPSNRVTRDEHGRIIRPQQSLLRSAILAEIKRRDVSGHQLWKKAQKYCATIPESAVYEFLSGKRQVGLAYLDAMLEAMQLTVAHQS